MDKQKIGTFISELRHRKNISQEKLANILHVDRSLISKWENGKVIPDIIMINELSNIFNVSIDELIYGEINNSKNKNEIKNNFKEYLNNKKNKYNRIKSIAIISCIFLFVILFLFLLYYFTSTYNKTKVYKVLINDNYEPGLLIITKEEGFLKLGNIDSENGYVIIKYRNDVIENEIYKGLSNNVVINFYGMEEFKKNINDIYIIIDDKELKVNFEELYSNNLNIDVSTSSNSNFRTFSLEE